MPVSSSAKKALRRDRRRREVNLKVLGVLKKGLAAFRKKPTKAGLPKVFGILDRSVKAKVVHENKAARIKSRLSKLVAK